MNIKINLNKPISYDEFKKNAIITYSNKSVESAYYTFVFQEETIKFCISTHLSKHRKNLLTIISKNHGINPATRIAYDLYKERARNEIEKSYNHKAK